MEYKYTKIDITDKQSLSDFIQSVSKEFPYNDTFILKDPLKIPPHIHEDIEARLFLEGNAIFSVGSDDYACGPGSYIELDAGIEHSFKYSGVTPLKVLRFFSNDEGWVAKTNPED